MPIQRKKRGKKRTAEETKMLMSALIRAAKPPTKPKLSEADQATQRLQSQDYIGYLQSPGTGTYPGSPRAMRDSTFVPQYNAIIKSRIKDKYPNLNTGASDKPMTSKQKAEKKYYDYLIKKAETGQLTINEQEAFDTFKDQFGKRFEEEVSPLDVVMKGASEISQLKEMKKGITRDTKGDIVDTVEPREAAKSVYSDAIERRLRTERIAEFSVKNSIEIKEAEKIIANNIRQSKPIIDHQADILIQKGMPVKVVQEWVDGVIKALSIPDGDKLLSVEEAIKRINTDLLQLEE